MTIDLTNYHGQPCCYAIGVDNSEILGSWTKLEEAIEAARAYLKENTPWRIDLEIQDENLNPLHSKGGGTAVFVLYEETLEDEEDVPEEVEWWPVEGAPWEDLI